MDDKPEQPEQPTSEEAGSRKIALEELKRILAEHQIWVDTVGKEGENADLQSANLRGADLQGATLAAANLQEANLQEAILWDANLQVAYLPKTNLQGADFSDANLRGAILRGADLQGAYLGGTNLQDADLSDANLQGAYLGGANLLGANLLKASLQGADLGDANLQDTHLEGVNFERQEIAEGDERPGQDFPAANLTGANFGNASLSDAKLSTVTGLLTGALAGANLSNAKLPPNIEKFDGLAHVAETSKSAATVFFGLLGACLYSWLTIATTTDLGLIVNAANTPLPIINTPIPIAGFYYAAPLILLAVYVYFHLYLERLWIGLATLPAVFPDGKALDEKAYPWLLNGLVRAHFKLLRLGQRSLSRIENVITVFLAWWVVPLTLLAFWYRYIPRHDWEGTALHVGLIVIATAFGVRSYQIAVQTLRGEAKQEDSEEDLPLKTWLWRMVRNYHPDKWTKRLAIAVTVLSLSAAIRPIMTVGSWKLDLTEFLFARLGYRTYAHLSEMDISTRPPILTGREDKIIEETNLVKAANLRGKDLRHAEAERAYLMKARLESADLQYANLQYAFLPIAKLQDADLQHTRLRYADLRDADLRGADLRNADLGGVRLQWARLQGADLKGTENLIQKQLDQACGDEHTKLPPGLTIPRCADQPEQ